MFERRPHVFDRSGLASLSDIKTPESQQLFTVLEGEQRVFHRAAESLYSREYKWPRTALHQWSRVWEYPYVYHHLSEYTNHFGTNLLGRVVDVGSGFTFFPFAVAKLGYDVICADMDPVCLRATAAAIPLVPHAPGRVSVRLADAAALPFQDGEIDAAYCISVLEHIPECYRVVEEIARILKPDGLLVLTIDLDLQGNSEIGVNERHLLVETLHRHFSFVYPEVTVHPRDILHSESGPCRAHHTLQGLSLIWFHLKQELIKPLLGRRRGPMFDYHLATEGFVLRRIRVVQ